ncbi:DUF490 domain-containing protein [Paracoccus suum]|uniref:DUF490 domain-containing protein n=1 Tax=Paracoccus suum TaxID=2259340 RepID=A0A344PHP2_9RHOB|nr:translocation/assembly module TamB domain-containing protein [Paracoccus suum]AXC48897.1 DUF490 domain-containing protein [Paracoccus suum]
MRILNRLRLLPMICLLALQPIIASAQNAPGAPVPATPAQDAPRDPASISQEVADDGGFITRFLERNLSGAGREVRLEGFRGALSSRATFDQITIADADGVWLTLHNGAIQWNRSALLARRVEIAELSAETIELPRLPKAEEDAPKAEARSFSLPKLPVGVDIQHIAAQRVNIGAPVMGEAASISIDGAMSLKGGEGAAKLAINRVDGKRGVFAVDANYSNETQVLRIDTTLDEDAGGIFVNLIKLEGRPAVKAEIKGEGPLSDFAADIALASDGQPRITGTVAVKAEAAADGMSGRSFKVNIGGDVAAFVPPAQRAFFGAKSQLMAEGWRGDDGRLNVPVLSVKTEALDVSGTFAANAQGAPTTAALTLKLGADAGATQLPVRLPTTGTPITVNGGQLQLGYDAAKGSGWTLKGNLKDFAQQALSIAAVNLDGGGTVTLAAGELKMVGGKITFDTQGIAPTDPGLASAIGPTLKGVSDFNWSPGQAVTLDNLDIAGADYGLNGNLAINGLATGITVAAELDARYDDLARLSGIAGRDMTGKATGHVSGQYAVLGRGFDATARLVGTDLHLGQPQLDRLLAGDATIVASARRDENGINLREFTVSGQRLTADARGLLATNSSDVKANVRLTSLTEVDPAFGGSLEAEATLTGPAGARQVTVNGQAMDLSTGIAALDGALKGKTDVAVLAHQENGAMLLKTARLANPQLTIAGQGNLTPGQMDATLDVTVANLGDIQPGWAGNLAAKGRVTEADGTRKLSLNGTGDGLRFGTADVGEALTGTTRFDLDATQTGEQIQVDRLDVANDQLTANVSGPIGKDRTALDGKLAIKSLAAFGRGWRGSLDLAGKVSDDGAGGRHIDISGTGQDLSLGQAQADAALTGTTRLVLKADQQADGKGFAIQQAEIINEQAQVTAQGHLGPDGTDLTGHAQIASLAPFGRGWGGSANIDGSFRDDGTGARRLAVTGTGRDLAFGQPQLDGALKGETAVDVRAVERDGLFTIENAEIKNPQASVTAEGTVGKAGTDARAHLAMPSLAPLGAGYRGAIEADATLKQDNTGARNFTVKGTGRDLSLGQTQVDAALRGETRFDIAGVERSGVVTLERAVIDNPRLKADASGTVGGGATDISGNLRADSLAFLGRGLRGGINAEGSVRQQGTNLSLTAKGEGRGLAIGNAKADPLLAGTTSFDVAATRAGQNLTIQRLTARNPQLSLTAEGALASGIRVDARLADLALLAPGFPGAAEARGTVRRNGSQIGLDLDVTAPGGTKAKIAGTAAQDFSTVDIRANGTSDAAIANPFLRVRSVEGPVNFDLHLNGKPSLQALSGRISLPSARLSDPKLGVRIEALRLNAELGGGGISIDGGGNLADGGSLAVDGRIGLEGTRPINLTVRLNDAAIRDPNLYQTAASGTLTVSGNLAAGPLIAGRLTLDRTEIRIPSTGLGGAKGIPQITHLGDRPPVRATRAKAGLTPYPGAESREAGLAGPPATPPTVVAKLDITIDAPNQVFLRGRGVDAEFGGSIRLTGNARNVVPIGFFQLIRGRVDLLGKRFDLTEGLVELQGSLVPVIRLIAQTEQDSITTIISIEGEANDPKIKFSSIPDMPEEEVLSQLLFGRGLDNISPLQAAQLANAVAVLAGRGGEGIVSKLRNQIGLDDLDLATDAEGNVTVRAGKYITDKVYTDVAVGGDGKTKLNLNLDVTKALTARGSVDNEGESTLGLYYEKDY